MSVIFETLVPRRVPGIAGIQASAVEGRKEGRKQLREGEVTSIPWIPV